MAGPVLLLSIVPPLPPNQGNRRMTHAIVSHFCQSNGLVDGIFQCGGEFAQAPEAFDNRLLVTQTNAHTRRPRVVNRVVRQLILHNLRRLFRGRGQTPSLFVSANSHQPWRMLSDETVYVTNQKLREHSYDAIVCNYLYCLTALASLRAAGASLPPVIVFTHDAMSRLHDISWELGLDTDIRACTPAVEAKTLNLADVVVAITPQEKRYFEEIGVTCPIIVVGFPGFDCEAPAQTGAFETKKLVFLGGRNPMNTDALTSFIKQCWSSIKERVPSAEFHVYGAVGEGCTPVSGVHFHGVVPEASLETAYSTATVAVNPVRWGTGLKIKCVEAICRGVPLVTTSVGAEGLDEMAGAFKTADIGSDFTDAVIHLLLDEATWRRMAEAQLYWARTEFNNRKIFGPLASHLSQPNHRF